jgi:tRNA A-37 threonylcarbamoyl transferase component Bud32
MSEAVLDDAIEQIADGLSVDWMALDAPAPGRAREWAKSLRVLNDIVKLHREAAADYDQTILATMPASETAAVAEPQTWGKYRLADKVGEGSYGSVYRAWDSDLERDVAIKILHRRVGDTRVRERLLQEGRALAKVQHNNVVRVLGIEAHGDRVGLCMEFVRGKTLADIVRDQGRLSAAEAVLIGQDLARALSAVHRAGFIHRDVKAKNVMRDDAGRIVLMDFGTGRAAEARGGKNDRAGTPLYMAPEALGEGHVSARSDVYSLGVLLYYLVSGEYPVTARTVEELREAHANRNHRWLSEVRPDLPVAFMQVVERAIALDPEERYANASELLAALSALKIGARPSWIKLAVPALGVVAVVGGITLLGAITSTHYNIALQRSAFGTDTVWDWLRWGRLSSLPPFLILLVVVLALAVLRVIRRVVLAASTTAGQVDAALRRRGLTLVHRLRLDEVSVLASYALLVSFSALVLALWHFKPLLLQLLAYIPAADRQDLELLSPQYVTYHNYYRGIFSLVTILSVAAWLPVVKLVRKGQSLHWGMWLGGALATCIAVACLHLPYRLLIYRNYFDIVRWNEMRCSVIGENATNYLLFCPDVAPPRNRVVDRRDPALRFVGAQDRLFSHFGSVPPSH